MWIDNGDKLKTVRDNIQECIKLLSGILIDPSEYKIEFISGMESSLQDLYVIRRKIGRG